MNSTNGVEKIWNEIEEKNLCMLVTRDAGMLRARPMAAMPRRGENTIWFVTDRTNHKDEEIRADPEVCITFQDEKGNEYISISGSARMVEDRAKLKELWNTGVDAWFEGGADDPRAALIAVEPKNAEYWDNHSSDLLVMTKIVAASLTGREKPDVGENRKIDM